MNNIDISVSYNFITTSNNNKRSKENIRVFHYNNFYKKYHELMLKLDEIKDNTVKNRVNKIKISLIEKKQIVDSLLESDIKNLSKIYCKQNANTITPTNLVRNSLKNQKLLEELKKLSEENKNLTITELELRKKVTGELTNLEENRLRILQQLKINSNLAKLAANMENLTLKKQTNFNLLSRPNLHNA